MRSLDSADDGFLGVVAVADGYDGDFLEEGGEYSVEYSLMAIEEEEATLTMVE